jgi:hypothetical protein
MGSDPPKLRDFHPQLTEVEQAFKKGHAEAAAALHGAGTDAVGKCAAGSPVRFRALDPCLASVRQSWDS